MDGLEVAVLRLVLIGGLAAAALLLMRSSAAQRRGQAPAKTHEPAAPWRSPRPNLAVDQRPDPQQKREQAMRALADQLMFRVDEREGRYALFRDADVPEPVRRDGLTLEEAERILSEWKLRGFHGG